MTVADRIRNRRIELELSQAELAKRANYSDKTAISKLENAGNDVTMKQVRRLANALDVTPAYLMGWEDQEPDERVENDLVALALQHYALYKASSPEVQAAVDLLLKSVRPTKE